MRPWLVRNRFDLLIAPAIFLFWPLLLLAPVTLGGRTLLPADNLIGFEPWTSVADDYGLVRPYAPHNELLSDLILENYVWKQFVNSAIDAGEVPLWNPNIFAGAPFLATGQHSALYPFSILFYFLPLATAYGWFALSQYFLAGLTAYLLLRVLGAGRLGALIAGTIYQLSLFMVVSAVFPMIVAGAVWLPLILAAIELVVLQQPALGGRPASLPWMSLGAVGFGMVLLAGHPEVVAYTALVSAAYAAWRLAPLVLRRASWRAVLRPTVFLLAMVALGVGLGSVQFVPLLDLLPDNFRSGAATLAQVRSWGFPARRLLTFVVPNFFGNPSHHEYFDLFAWRVTPVSVNARGDPIQMIDWGIKNYVEGGAYVGILALLLAGLGVWAFVRGTDKRSQSAPFFALLAGASLAFIFGTPLYAAIYYLPGMNQLHSPFRWVWPLSLAVAVLAGWGARYLQRLHATRPAALRLLAGALILAGSATFAALGAARVAFARLAPFIARALAELALASRAFADGRMFFSYEAVWIAVAALMLIGAGIVLWAVGSPRRIKGRPVWELLAVIVVGGDLLIAGAGFNPSADARILEYTPPAVEYLRADESRWRFTTYDPGGRKPMNANTGWMFNLEDVRGYDSIIPRQYARYMGLIQPQGELQFNRIAPIDNPQSLDSPLLDLLNVKYVLTLDDIDSPKYTLVEQESGLRIYRNEGVLPRAFTLPEGCAVAVDDFGAGVQVYDPRQYVLLESDSASATNAGREPSLSAAACTAAPATITLSAFNTVVVDVQVEAPAFLVLADSYARGWLAFVRPFGADEAEETELTLLRANGNFRAVLLSPGAHTVRFRFSPDSFKLGGFLSAMAAMTLVFVIGTWLWRYAYRESAIDSPARRVAKNSLAPMALSLLNRLIDFVFAAFYLRVLGPGEAGNYTTAIVLIGWFDIWTNFGLNTWLTREAARDRSSASRFLSNTTIFRLLLGGGTFPIFVGGVVLYQLQTGALGNDTVFAVVLLAFGIMFSSITNGLSALFYAYEQAEYPAAITSVTTILKVSFGAVALLLGYGFVGLAGSTIVVNFVTMVIMGTVAWRLYFRPTWNFDRDMQREMARDSFPLMLNHLLATLFFKIDVPMIRAMRGDAEVGRYGAAYKFVDAFNVIPSFFTLALFPVMSRQARNDRAGLQRTYHLALKLLVGTAIPTAIVATTLATPLIGLLGGREFLPDGARALQLMVWSIPFGWINSVTNYLLISVDQQRALTRAFVIGLTFNVVINAIFIPRYGFAAAAVSTILSELVEGMAFQFYVYRHVGRVPWVKLFWRLALAGAVMGGLVLLFGQVYILLGLAVG
ncbi:MAG: oligosaccharide flippase family protein, partial [Anaerolineales bacterium]